MLHHVWQQRCKNSLWGSVISVFLMEFFDEDINPINLQDIARKLIKSSFQQYDKSMQG